jgi:alpha-L-fucosidase
MFSSTLSKNAVAGIIILLFPLFASAVIAQTSAKGTESRRPDLPESISEDIGARMQWWREARFGMFIHWGVYAIPARGEWVMNTEKIPIPEYEKFPPQFNPAKFDAAEWVKLAKEAGMKYIVITSKHHDGFCMWDSRVTNYDIIDATPFKRDALKEIADACQKEGVRFCFYHSIMDWHHPEAVGAAFPTYREEVLKPQLKELLTGYGKLGVLWFDGEWIPEWSDAQGRDLYNYVRGLQPEIIINNRVSASRAGMQGMSNDVSAPGDFGTPEQEIPPAGLEGVDWESCMTMNDHWGYAVDDHNWKTPKQLIHNLVDIASKGGNYLLNVGPTAEGVIPDASVQILKEIGRWIQVNGESVYGTQSSPFYSTPWGRCTEKVLPDGRAMLYLHVFDWPEDGRLIVDGLGDAPRMACLLSHPDKILPVIRQEGTLIVSLPHEPVDSVDAVIALEFEKKPVVYQPPEITALTDIFVNALNVDIKVSSPDLEVRYTLDGAVPTKDAFRYVKTITLTESATLKAQTFRRGKPVSAVVERAFQKVKPQPAAQTRNLADGLQYECYEGNWDALPDFDTLQPVARGAASALDVRLSRREDEFGLRFSGYILIPKDDVYRFALGSDDGSRLVIDGREEIDNDGLHAMAIKTADIALAAGAHPIVVTFFEKGGGQQLLFRMAPVGEPLKEVGSQELKHERPH